MSACSAKNVGVACPSWVILVISRHPDVSGSRRMTMQALPGTSLEVVKTKFFFHLLVSLFANPTRLDSRP